MLLLQLSASLVGAVSGALLAIGVGWWLLRRRRPDRLMEALAPLETTTDRCTVVDADGKVLYDGFYPKQAKAVFRQTKKLPARLVVNGRVRGLRLPEAS